MRRPRILIAAVCSVVGLFGGCTDDATATQSVRFVVPGGIAGTVEVVALDTGDKYASVFLEDGRATATINHPGKQLVARFKSLTRLEYATGDVASAGDLVYELPIPTSNAETVTVVFSVPALQAWAAAHGDQARAASWLEDRERAVTCGREDLRGTLTRAVPIDRDDDSATGSLTPAVLSLLFAAAESHLPLMLAEQSDGSPARTTSLLYAFHTADDASDGVLDAQINGIPISMADGIVVPRTYQRQLLAQALRRAADADSERNPTGIRSQDILDILRCISEDDAPNYGPGGEQFDFVGPATALTWPVVPEGIETLTINGRVKAACEATDDSPIDSMSLYAYRGDTDITAIALEDHQTRLNQDTPSGQPVSTVSAEIVTGSIGDGPLVIICEARDRWHNTSRDSGSYGSMTLNVDTTAATASVVLPEDGASISGTAVRIECRCEDSSGSVDCALLEPTGDSVTCNPPVPVPATETAAGSAVTLSCTLDSTQRDEGPVVITCGATSPGFSAPTPASVGAIVDNFAIGSADIVATLDSRLRGGHFAAREFGPAGIGKVVSLCGDPADCTSDDNGRVRIPLSDSYSGDLIVEMASRSWDSPAHYTFVPDGSRIEIPPNHPPLRLVLEDYSPGRTLSGALSGLSHLAACYVLGAMASHGYEESLQLADTLVGGHFATRPIAFRWSVPRDLTRDTVSSLDDAALSALANTGAAFVCDRAAKDIDPNMSPVPTHVYWDKLCQDVLYELRLNGQTADGTLTLFDNGASPLSGDSFRWSLASGMDDFVLRTTPLDVDGISRPYNASGLTRADLGCRNCLYNIVSMDTSNLFDPANAPMLPFDRENPTLWCLHPSPDGTDVVASAVPVLDCGCRDNLGVDSLAITSPMEWTTLDQDSAGERLFAVNLSVDDIADLDGVDGDYALNISLACYDEVRNEGTTAVSVTVDQTPPTVEIRATGLGVLVNGTYVVTSSPVEVVFDADDGVGVKAAKLNGEDATQIDNSTYSGTLTLEAGRVVSARAEAWDHAGHTDDDTAQLLYTTAPPTVEITSPVANKTYGSTLDVVATVVDPTAIPIARVTIHEPPEYGVAAVTIDGAKATVSLLEVSSAPLRAMAEAGHAPRVCISATNVAELANDEPTCVTGFIVDTNSPTGEVVSPQSGTTVTTSSIDVQTRVADPAGVDSVTVDGLPAAIDAETGYWVRTLTSLPEGEKHIVVRAEDDLENDGLVDSVVIHVDTQPPTATIELRSAPNLNEDSLLDLSHPVRDTAWLIVHADDVSGVAGSQVTIGSSETSAGEPVQIGPCDHDSCVAYPIDTTTLEDGPQQVHAVVWDTPGTRTPKATLDIVVDNHAPQTTISTNVTTTNQRRVEVTVSTEDTVGPIKLRDIVISGPDGASTSHPIPSSGTGPWSVDLPDADGIYDITVHATDDAKHTGTSNSVSVGRDTGRPVVNAVTSNFPQRVESSYTARGLEHLSSDIRLWEDDEPLLVYRSHFIIGSGTIPTWKFVVHDADGPVQTNDADMPVEFRYSILDPGAQAWRTAIDWRSLHSDDAPFYVIHGNAETLTTAAVAADAAARHRLEVQTTDAAGNASPVLETEFSWGFRVIPVIVSGCTPTDELTSSSLRNRTMDEFHSGADIPTMNAMLYWPLQAVGDATLHDATADVAFSGGQVTTAFSEITAQVEEGDWPEHDEVCNLRHMIDRCYGLSRDISTGEFIDIPSFPRTIGPDDWCTVDGMGTCGMSAIWWADRGDVCECNHAPRNVVTLVDDPGLQWTHQTKYSVPAAGPEFGEGVRVRLLPDRDYPMAAIADSPQVFVDSNLYDWSEFSGDAGTSYWYADRTLFGARAQPLCRFTDGSGIVPICVNPHEATEYVSAVRLFVARLLGQTGTSSFGGDVRVVFTEECLQGFLHEATMTGESTQQIADTEFPND